MRSTAILFAVSIFIAAGADIAHAKEIRLFVVVDGVQKENVEYFETTVVPNATSNAFAMIPGAVLGNLIVSKPEVLVTENLNESKLGLKYHGDRAKCYFSYDQKVLDGIQVLANRAKFVADRYLVILAGNHIDGGCADGTTMFAGEGTPMAVFAHEMGHSFAGLYDEYGEDPSLPTDCVRWRNCSTSEIDTPWKPMGIQDAFPGCDGYLSGIYHSAKKCLMNSTLHQSFCTVCDKALTDALSSGLVLRPPGGSCLIPPQPASPWQKARDAKEGVDVTALIHGGNKIRVLRAEAADAEQRQPQVITGEAFAVAYLDGDIIAVAPLSIDGERDVLTARSFSNALGSFETRVPRDARLVRFTLLGVTVDDVRAKDLNLELGVRWIDDARDFLFVDDRTVARLVSAEGTTYPLGIALRSFLQQ